MSDLDKFTIRRATAADIAAVQALLNANLNTVLPRADDEMNDLINSFFIVDHLGKIAGCCCLEVYSPKIAELRSLAVDVEYRGKGIGSRLVKKAVEEFKRLGIKQLLAVTSNIEFFKGHDFGPCLNEKFALFWNGKYL